MTTAFESARPRLLRCRGGQFGRLGLRWTVRPDVYFEFAGEAGAAGPRWTLDTDEMEFGLAVTAGVRTPIGPVALTFAGDGFRDVSTVGFRLGPDF
ncbi:MAG: hypothetical protein ACODAA_08710 [Gemmatimonadota bacterium]